MDTPTDATYLARMARRLAARLEGDPNTLASVFARYRAAEGLDDTALAAYFAIDPDVLPHVALCGRPREGLFQEDVTAVAERFGLDPGLLALLVRHVDALQEFQRGGVHGRGQFLAAARDRAAEDAPLYDSSPDPAPKNAESAAPDHNAKRHENAR